MQKYNQMNNVNGLLYYLRMNKLINVKFKFQEMVTLIHRRNKLAKYLKNIDEFDGDFNFPKMIDNPDECNKCFMSTVCSIVNQTIEYKQSDKVELKNTFKQRKTINLDLHDIEEFKVNDEFKIYYEIKGSIA